MAKSNGNGTAINLRHAALFFGMFVIGTAVLASAKIFIPDAWKYLIIFVAFVFMSAYAILVTLVPATKLRLDIAADNLYYLGFLYTLSSLAVALSIDDPGRILSNFGVAIASTLIGIAARVGLSQLRLDPYDIEEASRSELSNATQRVRNELDASILQLKDFQRLSVQSMNEGFGEVTRSVDAITIGVMESVEQIAVKSSKPIAELVEKSNQSSIVLLKTITDLRNASQELIDMNRAMTTEMKNVSDAMKGLSEYYSDTGFIEGKLIKALDASINDLKTNFSKDLKIEIETLIASVEKSQRVSKKLDNRADLYAEGFAELTQNLEKKFSEAKIEILESMESDREKSNEEAKLNHKELSLAVEEKLSDLQQLRQRLIDELKNEEKKAVRILEPDSIDNRDAGAASDSEKIVKKVKTAEQNIAEAKIAKKKWELLEEKRRADRWSRINEADEKEMKMNDMLKRLGLGRM